MKEILELHKLWLETDGNEGVKANLQDADLRCVNFQHADLRYANFQYADFQDADLRCVNFQHADLRYANFRYANFQYADFQDADLRCVNFQHADLRYANFRYADLWYANFQYADIRGANLDFSAWPLWCGSENVKIDERQAIQLFAHVFNVGLKYWPGGLTNEQIDFINRFHQPGFKVQAIDTPGPCNKH